MPALSDRHSSDVRQSNPPNLVVWIAIGSGMRDESFPKLTQVLPVPTADHPEALVYIRAQLFKPSCSQTPSIART